MTDETSDADRRNAEFLALLGKHELQVAMCVHTLVPSWHDAEDIIQEVRLQLWREFAKFQPGSDFPAWARTIARYAVRRHVTMSQRKPLLLSSDVEDVLMAKIAGRPKQQADGRLPMLAECVRKLGSDALDLLRRCYIEKQKIKDVAAEMGRSLAGTYQAVSRVRRELLECMREHLRQEENR
jgi:RNA polymerase sigma-70 factor (ECF subfamily)